MEGEKTRSGHWRGAPVYGNTHGKLWFELDDDDDEYDPDSRGKVGLGIYNKEDADKIEAEIDKPYGDDQIVIDIERKERGEIPTPYGPVEIEMVWLHFADKLWNVYKYEFLEWVYVRKGKKEEVIV